MLGEPERESLGVHTMRITLFLFSSTGHVRYYRPTLADSSDVKLKWKRKPGGISEDAPELTVSPIVLVSVLKSHTEYKLYFFSFPMYKKEVLIYKFQSDINPLLLRPGKVQVFYIKNCFLYKSWRMNKMCKWRANLPGEQEKQNKTSSPVSYCKICISIYISNTRVWWDIWQVSYITLL